MKLLGFQIPNYIALAGETFAGLRQPAAAR